MTRRLLGLALVAGAVGAVAAGCDAWGIDPDLERMIDQARVDPYEPSPYFADGRAMRPPPDGTVSRERVVGEPDYTDGVRGGVPVASLPVPVTAELVARGRDRFEIVCAACHGLVGDGDSKVAENMTLRKPRSLHDPQVRAYPPGRIFQVISRGYGFMPAFAYRLSVDDRWAIVAYVRALQLARDVGVDELPPPLQQEADEALRAGAGAAKPEEPR